MCFQVPILLAWSNVLFDAHVVARDVNNTTVFTWSQNIARVPDDGFGVAHTISIPPHRLDTC